MSFYALEPFGGEVNLLGHAITSATIANVNRTKGARSYQPDDFMPKFTKEAQTVEQQMQFAEMITAALGGQDLRKDKE